MSRRPPPGPDKTEQNRATLKQLVKLEANKSCADCKRNKHPRWASWNLGIFICIRCSGIHRGMGTHISRVKSVDLDSWTDEQMASMIKWGNGRANKYWEAKLADGHVPNEAKIENFIRTKYDSKRWVMDGPMPDPSTLGDGVDDDVPLNVVQENLKAKMGGPQQHTRNGSASGVIAGPPRAAPAAAVRQPQMDLFGDEPSSRPSTTEPVAPIRSAPQRASAAPPKQTRPGESLLGLDFFGGAQSAPPARAASTGSNAPGVSGRTDLKQSILSLYASKPAAPPSQPATNAFGGLASPPLASPSTSSSLGTLGDAFGSLSFASPAQQQPKAAPFSNFSPPVAHSQQSSTSKPTNSSSLLSGGSFFDAKPAPPPKTTMTTSPRSQQQSSFDADFGDFSAAASPPLQTASAIPTSSKQTASTSSMGDLFDLTAPDPPPKPAAAPAYTNSAFNLSQPAKPAQPAPAQDNSVSKISGFNNMDAWGSSDAWATPDTAPATASANKSSTVASAATSSTYAPQQAATSSAAGMFDSGWGNETKIPTTPAASNTATSAGGFSVQQDEEFGGWSHASPVATTPGPRQTGGGSGGGGGQDDLFGNVWG